MASRNSEAEANTVPHAYDNLSPLELEGLLAELKRTNDQYIKDSVQRKTELEKEIEDRKADYDESEEAKKNEIQLLRNELSRLEGGKDLRDTIHNGKQAETRRKIAAADTILHGQQEFYEKERKRINDRLHPPPPEPKVVPQTERKPEPKAEPKKPAPKRGSIKKRVRKMEDSDDEGPEVQPPPKKVASGKTATVEDHYSETEYMFHM